MTKLIQIVPRTEFRLFGGMVKKEIELNRKGQGTFFRSGPKARNKAKWSHVKYKGWINLQRGTGEVVTAEVRSLSHAGDDWQLLQAFVGWLDRHFGDRILSLNVQYQK